MPNRIFYIQRFCEIFKVSSIKDIEKPKKINTELHNSSQNLLRLNKDIKSLCHFYVWMIWNFNSGLPSWAYKYIPINNLGRPTPNQKYESKWELRISLKFIELKYKKIAVFTLWRREVILCIWRVFIMIIASIITTILFFINFTYCLNSLIIMI